MPALRLTDQDELEMRQLSAQLEHEIVSQYENYVFHTHGGVDASKWKLARTDGTIHVYKENRLRRPHAPTTKRTSGPQQMLVDATGIPRVLITGTIPGTLDDVMYGMSFHDTASLQNFWVGQRDAMEESAVVATLDGPILDDPYRFLGAIWFLRTFPLNLIQRRDTLEVAVCRMTQLRNGDRVGIVAGHSIEHRDLPERNELKTIRATSSILKVFRQLVGNRVEVFMIHYLDTKGSVPEIRHVYESIAQTVTLAASMHNVGFAKKLASLVARRKRNDQDALAWEAIEPQSSGTNEYCEMCDKKIGTLFTCPGTSCQLCYGRICSQCSVTHDLVVRTSAGTSALKAHDFCVRCLLQARTIPTLWVAQNDLHQRNTSSMVKPRQRVLTTLMATDLLMNGKRTGSYCCSH